MSRSMGGPKLVEIGNRCHVVGRRGQWDIVMYVRTMGESEAIPVSVRRLSRSMAMELEARPSFLPIFRRDDARAMQRQIQFALADGTILFAQIESKGVVEFSSREFDGLFREPKNQDVLFSRTNPRTRFRRNRPEAGRVER